MHKTKSGTANRWETPTVIGNHMETSLWLANQKQARAIRSYLLHSWDIRRYLRCTNYAKMLGHAYLAAFCVLRPILMCRVPYWALLGYSYSTLLWDLEEHFSQWRVFFLQFCTVRGARPVIRRCVMPLGHVPKIPQAPSPGVCQGQRTGCPRWKLM